jgi:hypothetical protein
MGNDKNVPFCISYDTMCRLSDYARQRNPSAVTRKMPSDSTALGRNNFVKVSENGGYNQE